MTIVSMSAYDGQTVTQVAPVWEPSEEDLTDYMRGLVEQAFLNRPRMRCSRQDFASGAVGLLVAMRYRLAFRDEVWQAAGEAWPEVVGPDLGGAEIRQAEDPACTTTG